MAIVKPSPLVGAIAGPVGGVTFVSSGRGMHVRGLANTVHRLSAGQGEARGVLSRATLAWRGLTDVQRSAWRAGASAIVERNALGVSRALTGFEFFVRSYGRAMLKFGNYYYSPPATCTDVPCRITSVESAPTGYVTVWLDVPNTAFSWKVLGWIASQDSGGGRAVAQRWKRAFWTSWSSASFAFPAQHTYWLGYIPQSGVRIALKMENLTTGLWSLPSIVEYIWGSGRVYY